MKKILILVLFAALISGSAHAQKIYLRTSYFGSSLSISWIYLGANGVIVKNPKFGVNPVNLPAEQRDNASNTGKYTIKGDRMQITWQNGKTSDWRVEMDGIKMKALDGGITTEQKPLPTGFRLNGRYAAGAVTANAASTHTLVFKSDGTFTESSLGTISTAETGAASQSAASGRYSIIGNTLTLTYSSGKKVTAVITVWEMYEGKKRLIINQSSYPQEN